MTDSEPSELWTITDRAIEEMFGKPEDDGHYHIDSGNIQALAHRVSEIEDSVEGYLIVQTFANNLDRQEWVEEFREFYKPEQWINSRRAACAFLSSRVAVKPLPIGGMREA